ncbi:hypothetical protein CHS0354_040555 [Potamilus streckersoni]|uniref:Uncharacterized protein n=1 Tax=Potamilus streckersoni TaxID=2493646 RepID=A0AAE0VVI8_9BIVA|nr:hypothetical protein CHS0354_040555 [Potamilus streckersoni]
MVIIDLVLSTSKLSVYFHKQLKQSELVISASTFSILAPTNQNGISPDQDDENQLSTSYTLNNGSGFIVT